MLVVFASSFLFVGALSATCDECWNDYWDCDWNAQSLAWEECSKIWEEGSEYVPFDRQCIEEQAVDQVECYSNAGCFEAGNEECWWKLWELGCDPYKCEAYNICYQNEINQTNCDQPLNECEQNCDDSGYDGYDSWNSYNYYDSFGDYNDYGDSYNFDYYDSYNNYDSFDNGYNYNYYGPEQQEWQYAYDEIPDCIKTKCGGELDQCASSDSCVQGIENVANKCYMDYEDVAQCMDDTFINIDVSNNGNEGALELCDGDEICSNDLQALGECVVTEANYGECQSVTDCRSLKKMVKLVRGRRSNLLKQKRSRQQKKQRGKRRNQRVRPRSQLSQRRRRQSRGRRAARRQ